MYDNVFIEHPLPFPGSVKKMRDCKIKKIKIKPYNKYIPTMSVCTASFNPPELGNDLELGLLKYTGICFLPYRVNIFF